MYLRHTYDAIIDGNTIHANGVGDPIKLREDCRRTIIRNNKVYVGCWGFIVDYPESTESASSDTEIYDNFFYLNDDSTSVNTDLDIYKGPVWNPNRSPFISEFYDNTMNCEFSGDDGHYVYGVACEDTCTYVAVNQPDYHRNYIYKFLKREGPIFKICLDQLPYYNNIRGDMCTTDSYVIASTVKYIDAYTDSINVYRIRKDGINSDATYNAPRIFASTSDSDIITALCSYSGNEFLTAITGPDSVRIYKGADSVGGLKNTWLWSKSVAVIDSITAMTYNHTYNRLLIATQEGTSARIYLGSTQNPDSTTVYGPTANRHVQAMSLGSSNYLVVTALKNSSTNYLYIYDGTYTNPVNSQRFSSYSRDCNGLAGYGDYRYTSLNGSSYNRKLYWGSTVNPLYQILYNSQWWSEIFVE